jgi:hypothetical protein
MESKYALRGELWCSQPNREGVCLVLYGSQLMRKCPSGDKLTPKSRELRPVDKVLCPLVWYVTVVCPVD